jgi:hypothetical protein
LDPAGTSRFKGKNSARQAVEAVFSTADGGKVTVEAGRVTDIE